MPDELSGLGSQQVDSLTKHEALTQLDSNTNGVATHIDSDSPSSSNPSAPRNTAPRNVAPRKAAPEVASHEVAGRPLGADLSPVLEQACEGCLQELSWFRTDWQRSGALTGYAKWFCDGDPIDVVVKLPVPPVELRWYQHLTNYENVCPRLFAGGIELGGYDMAWIVIERLAHGPLSNKWQGDEFDLIIQALGRFYAATNDRPVVEPAADKDWHAVLKRSREHVKRHSLADAPRWAAALKKAARKVEHWLTIWNERPKNQWVHGDFHLGNAMTRYKPPSGPAMLFDFACIRPGHWLEDALYLEHLFWARRDKLDGKRICSMVAQERKRHGLPVHADWPQWADARRALFAMSTPAMLEHLGDPMHVQASLALLEDAVKH